MPYYKGTRFSIWHFMPNLTLPRDAHLNGFLGTLPAGGVILDIGSGGRFINQEVVSYDKFVTGNTKVVGDIHQLPFKDGSADCVICTGTLEHIEDPWLAAREMHRVLKPGGKAYIAAPFMQGYHPDPADYWRFTEQGLMRLFPGLRRIDSGCLQGSGSGLSWALIDFFRAQSDSRYVSEGLGVIARFAFFWVKYFDVILRRRKNNRLFASGYFFIGMKDG